MPFPLLSTLTVIAATAMALALALRLAFARIGRTRASFALAACLVLISSLEILDQMTMLNPAELMPWRTAGLLLEGALCPAWICFTALFARDYEHGRLPWMQRILLGVSALMPLWAGYLALYGVYFAPDFVAERILFLLPGGFYFYIALTLCCVAALFNIEATLAGAVHHRRWKIKFVLLGAACILAALVLYFSQALLYRSIDMNLISLRTLALLLGVSMMWYSDLRRGPEVRISFSKRMAFKSVVLIAAGLYLVGLGLLGEGSKLLDDEWGRAVLLGSGFLAGLGLIVLFLSDKFRRKIRLFLQLHFYGEKYDYRIQWVNFTESLVAARSQDELHQAALAACCETFGIVGASLFLLDHTRKAYMLVSMTEMDDLGYVFPDDSPLILKLRTRHSVVSSAEAEDPSPWMQSAQFTIPIFREDNLDGFILLGPSINAQEEYDEEDFELMNTMARHISSALLNMRLLEQLARARDMEVMGRVSAFVLHDLKNHVYTLSLMADNARKFIGNPEFQKDMVDSLASTVDKMKILIAQLKNLPDRQTLKRTPVRLLTLAREATQLIRQGRLVFSGEDVKVMVDSEEMGKVVLNLCLNALEASADGQEVQVSAGYGPDPFVRVTDQGQGIEDDFLKTELFKAFRSTKAKGMGIGLYQCKQIVEAHGGRIDVTSTVGKGSEFTVWLRP